MRLALYAIVALSIVGFTFAYGLLYWLKRQAPERRARVIGRMTRLSDQWLQLFVRAAPVWAVVMSVLLLVALIVASVFYRTR